MNKKILLSCLLIAIASNLCGMLPKEVVDKNKIPENFLAITEITIKLIQQAGEKATKLNQCQNLSVQGTKTINDWLERIECAKIWLDQGLWRHTGRAYDEIASVTYEMHNILGDYTTLKIQKCLTIMGKLLNEIKAEKQKCEQPITIRFKDNLVEWMNRLEKIKLLNKSNEPADIKKTHYQATFLLGNLQTATKDLWLD